MQHMRIGLRRLRQDPHIRGLTREVRPALEQFIQPLFVVEGIPSPEPIPGLTGVLRDTPDSLLRQVESDLKAGVSKFLLFGVPVGRQTHDIDWSFTAGQVAALKKRFGKDLWLSVDVCLCSSTPHGHCGVLNPEGDHVDNAASVAELAGRGGGVRHGRRRLRRAQRHDGRPHRGDPCGAREGRPRPHAAHELRGKIPLAVLRPVPRRGGFGAEAGHRPQGPLHVPDRSGAPGRCAAAAWSAMSPKARTS